MTAYPPFTPAPAERRERSSGAKALLAVGVAMAVLGGILAVVGFGLMADGAGSLVEQGEEVRDGLEVEVDVPGQATVALEEETYTIYVLDPFDSATEEPEPSSSTPRRDSNTSERPDPMVRIIDPDGQEVPQREPGVDAAPDLISSSVLPTSGFRAPEAGTYTVEVTNGDAKRIGVGEAFPNAELIGRTVGGGALGLLGVAIGGLGTLLAIAGLIWFLASGGPPGINNR